MTTPNDTPARARAREAAAAPNLEQKVPGSPRPQGRPRIRLRDVARALRAVADLNPDAVRTYKRARLINIVFDQAVTLHHLAEITLYLMDYLAKNEKIKSSEK